MRFRLHVVVVLFCLLGQSATAQTSTVGTQTTQVSATSQVSVSTTAALAQAVTQLGWDRGHAVGGLVAQGVKVSLDSKGLEIDSTPVVLKVRADHRFRMELGSGDVLTVADAVASIRRAGSLQAHQQLPHVAVSMAAPYFPFLTDLANVNDLALSVASSPTATINGEPAAGFSIRRGFPDTAKFRPARESSSALTLWVSQKTGLPIRLDFFRLAADNWQVKLPFSLYFSQWQAVNGVMVPMQIDEGSGGHLFTRMRFSSVQLDSTISDSAFTSTTGGGTN